ncbi:MAG: 50S ribosomal protein L23 [Gemmatimonadetes bacterium]|nr:50S ribosomal protein L23 [Gemmatimonadota bacterium]MYI07099.1 50S ribosomal protein L23 [Gemmatimonadota bacterium]
MRESWDVLVSPVITEKTTEQMAANLYTFIVNKKANKHDITRAVEALWDVTVQDVRTMRYPGKAKRALLGRMAKNWNLGRRPSFKKAVVQLAEGDEIEFYEMG